jgi:hypothetical protein
MPWMSGGNSDCSSRVCDSSEDSKVIDGDSEPMMIEQNFHIWCLCEVKRDGTCFRNFLVVCQVAKPMVDRHCHPSCSQAQHSFHNPSIKSSHHNPPRMPHVFFVSE